MKKFFTKPINLRPLGKGWKKTQLQKLEKNSQIASTALGPIEYSLKGEGPVIVSFHGSPGGVDQMPVFLDDIVKKGFSLLSFSRPGYLKTPLSSGKTLKEQSALLNALLMELNIDKVILYARASGGPFALQFAEDYSEKIDRLVLESAVVKDFDLKKSYEKLFPEWLFNDLGMWIYQWLTFISPKATVRQLVTIESLLNPKQIAEISDHILAEPSKLHFLFRLIKSLSPISVRKEGILNDLTQFHHLPSFNLQALTLPCFILHGTHDADVPFEHAEFAKEKMPHATFFPVDLGFHLLKLSPKSDEIEKALLEFLRFT